MYELKFPDLKFIKSHKRHPDPKDKAYFEEYSWEIFDIDNFGFCRIKYNEDDNNMIFLDIMCKGFCDTWRHRGFNKAYPATARGYEKLKQVAKTFFNQVIEHMIESNNINSEEWSNDIY